MGAAETPVWLPFLGLFDTCEILASTIGVDTVLFAQTTKHNKTKEHNKQNRAKHLKARTFNKERLERRHDVLLNPPTKKKTQDENPPKKGTRDKAERVEK